MLRGILGTGGSAPVGGSGTPDTIPRWATGTTLGNSAIKQDSANPGTNILVGGNVSPYATAGRTSLVVDGSSSSLLAFALAGSGAAYINVVSGSASFVSVSRPIEIAAGGANQIAFTTNSLQRACIDSTGRLLVGTTLTPNLANNRQVLSSSGDTYFEFADSASAKGWIFGINTTGQVLAGYSVIGAVGSETYKQEFAFDVPNKCLNLAFGNNINGLKLPATPGNADTQTLDAYQENGSWTPTLAGFGGTAPTVTSARWTRVGRMVFCELLLNSTGTFSSTVGTTTVSAPATAAVEAAVPTNFSGGNSGVGAQSGATVFLPTVASSTLARITWQFSV